MPQLFLALEGKVDFLKKTNPFGAPEKKAADPAVLAKANMSLEAVTKKAATKVGMFKHG